MPFAICQCHLPFEMAGWQMANGKWQAAKWQMVHGKRQMALAYGKMALVNMPIYHLLVAESICCQCHLPFAANISFAIC